MTKLQQMAFDRIGGINGEALKLLPCRLKLEGTMEIPVEDFEKLKDLMYEQQSWVEALWSEEQKDGFEELI